MDLFSSSSSLLLCSALISVLLVLLLVRHGLGGGVGSSSTKGRRLPPGPSAVVFLAKFLALRRSIFDLGPLIRELHARHGPVISVRLLFRTLVFVADRRLVHRVLVQAGATFADRPPQLEPSLLFTAGLRDISSSPYGAYWRLLRRNLAAEALHPARVSLFAAARRRMGDALLADLLRLPASGGEVEVKPLFRRALFQLFVNMSLGASSSSLGQETMEEIQELQLKILRSITSFPVFAFFPKWLLRGRWEAYVAVRRRQEAIFLPLINARRSRSRRSDDDEPPCYADSLLALRLASEDDRPLTDSEMVSLCSEFLNAGTDTSVTVLEWIMAELVNHPDVQDKLRHELINSSSGEGGGAGGESLSSPPYLKAVVLEGLRLHPPAHFLLPHAVQGDDAEIAGYAVPKGCEVNFLLADIARDDTVWTAPMEFRPDRFLAGGEGCDVDITGTREIKMMPFGAGRRFCPGYTLGLLNVEYLVGSLVRDLQWLPPADAQPVDMAEVLDFTTVMKHPLRARVIPIITRAT